MKKSGIIKSFLSLFIICQSLLLSTLTAFATVSDGVYAYEKGNYDKARNDWLPYAALGNPNALYNLGQLYRMGRGVDVDYMKAKEYYLRAAEKSHVGAQRNLGTLYYFGRIGKIEHKKALNWLTRAAVNGDVRSQHMIGTMYFNGEGDNKNVITAYAWTLLASHAGLNKAADTIKKMAATMTSEQISEAKAIAPAMINLKLAPDDVGLMIKQPVNKTQNVIAIVSEQPKPIKENPEPSPVTETTALSVSVGLDKYRVQLGSYGTKKAAQNALKALNAKLPDLIDGIRGNVEYADLGERGIFFRLQLSPFHIKTDADNFCTQLQENGQPCYVVKTP